MKLTFEKLANFVRQDEYAKISVPFKKGELFDENLVSIVDSNGNELIVQNEAVARYKDNSIKWVLVHFLATLNANAKTEFEVIIREESRINNKMDIDSAIKNLTPLILYYNINGMDCNMDINFAELDEVEVVKSGAVFTDFIIRKKSVLTPTRTLDVVVYVTAYNNKDYTKIDIKFTNSNEENLYLTDAYVLYKTKYDAIEKYIALSNYKTKYIEDDNKNILYNIIDKNTILHTSNEHYPETFYGVYYGVVNEKDYGVAITIKEAFQNYPKAFGVDKNGISAYLIPEEETIKFNSGVSKTHTIYVQKFDDSVTKKELNQRHLQFQMPDLPVLDSNVYKEIDLFENLFTDKKDKDIEAFLVELADSKGWTYGMMHFGDVYDKAYTNQGRGGNHLVFSNNQYDYPFNSYLLFIRNGSRRFFDYFSASARHMMDLDICHFSNDRFRVHGLIEHCSEHTSGDVILHNEWVRGLIEYYHATGDIFAKEAFLNIGENILLNLSRPEYSDGFEVDVREIGWALYALVALYDETHEQKYFDACEKITNHLIEWQQKYGALLSPYTDHTLIRVPFMIAIACNSLYAYYRVSNDERIKKLILDVVDDLIDNALLENGFFYYKELPSLQRIGINPLILETLANCYILTNDKKYLDAGISTFRYVTTQLDRTNPISAKTIKDNIVLVEGTGTKRFAQSFYPITKFYTELMKI